MKSPLSHPAGKDMIGIFNDSFPPILDGVTLTVENYVHWLGKKGYDPCVVTPWNPERCEIEKYEVMRYFSLPIMSRHPYRYGYPKLDAFIWKRLRNTDFRLLHSHCPFSSGRLAVYVKKHQNIPLIGTFHSKYRTDLEHSFRHTPWMVNIIMKRILDFFNACDEVWIPQAHVEETAREYGFKGKLTVVENGNDFATISDEDLPMVKKEARRALGIRDEELSLLFVGQHIWEKGIGVIADTLRKIKGKVKFRMNFVGTGYAFDELGEMIERYGLGDCVKLNGVVTSRDMLRRFYAAADLFLFPSFYDNAPLVVREAAALGTPSIILEGSTAAEVIRDGENGFLIDRKPEEYGRLLELISKDPEMLRKASYGARKTLVRSWEDVVGEVADRYETLVRSYRK